MKKRLFDLNKLSINSQGEVVLPREEIKEINQELTKFVHGGLTTINDLFCDPWGFFGLTPDFSYNPIDTSNKVNCDQTTNADGCTNWNRCRETTNSGRGCLNSDCESATNKNCPIK